LSPKPTRIFAAGPNITKLEKITEKIKNNSPGFSKNLVEGPNILSEAGLLARKTPAARTVPAEIVALFMANANRSSLISLLGFWEKPVIKAELEPKSRNGKRSGTPASKIATL
jgi:hypothetical protein